MGPLRRLLLLVLAVSLSVPAAAAVPRAAAGADTAGASAAGADSASAAGADSTAIEAPRYRVDPVVVTADRMPLSKARVPVDLYVVGQSRLATDRAYFVSDALREVPALEVQRAGGLGKLTQIRTRGADPRHSLVLFDGIPLDGPWVGVYDFADMMNPGFRRVEVLGGPASSLYGSGAMGGVIQVLSPTGAPARAGAAPADGRISLFAEYGGEATARQSAQWTGSLAGAPAGAALTRLTSEGTGSRDAYDGWNGNLSLEVPIGRDRLIVSGLGTQGEKELPYDFVFDYADPTLSPSGTWHEVPDPNNEETDGFLGGRAAWTHPVAGRSTLEAELSGIAGRIENSNPPNVPGGDFLESDVENTRWTAALRGRIAPQGAVSGVAGAEYVKESVEYSDAASFGGFASESSVDQSVRERAVYAQAHGERGRFLVDAGLRLDDQASYGAYGLPRIAAAFEWREAGLKLRGGYGRAFMAPTLSDLYFPYYGNPALRPERSTTWEAGADAAWLEGRLAAHFTWHTTRYIDLIQANSFFQAENIGGAEIEGEEVSVRFSPSPRFAAGAGAAHVDATNLETGEPLAGRPAWQASVSAEGVPVAGLTLYGAWRWVDSTPSPFDFVSATGEVLDGDNPAYHVLDLGASGSLARWIPLAVSLRCTNVLDEEYSEVKGFPAPPRMVSAGITYSFDMPRKQ